MRCRENPLELADGLCDVGVSIACCGLVGGCGGVCARRQLACLLSELSPIAGGGGCGAVQRSVSRYTVVNAARPAQRSAGAVTARRKPSANIVQVSSTDGTSGARARS